MEYSNVNYEYNNNVIDEEEMPFAMVNNCILRTFQLTSFEKLVYALLKSYAGNSRECFPSHNKVASSLQVSVSSVKRAIRGLEQKSLLKVVKRFKKNGAKDTNLYILLKIPARFKENSEEEILEQRIKEETQKEVKEIKDKALENEIKVPQMTKTIDSSHRAMGQKERTYQLNSHSSHRNIPQFCVNHTIGHTELGYGSQGAIKNNHLRITNKEKKNKNNLSIKDIDNNLEIESVVNSVEKRIDREINSLMVLSMSYDFSLSLKECTVLLVAYTFKEISEALLDICVGQDVNSIKNKASYLNKTLANSKEKRKREEEQVGRAMQYQQKLSGEKSLEYVKNFGFNSIKDFEDSLLD